MNPEGVQIHSPHLAESACWQPLSNPDAGVRHLRIRSSSSPELHGGGALRQEGGTMGAQL